MRSVERTFRVYLIKRMKGRNIFRRNPRHIVDTGTGDIEEIGLRGNTYRGIVFFNERYLFFMGEELVIFFSTSQSLLDVDR